MQAQAIGDAIALIRARLGVATTASIQAAIDAADIPGILNENRGPSDGTVFTAGALDTTGIGTVAGTRLIAGLNHLKPARDPAAEAQIDSRPI